MHDDLDTLLRRFDLKARVFFSGRLCGVARFDEGVGVGHLHMVRQGRLDVLMPDGTVQAVEAPAVLFFPLASAHRLQVADDEHTELSCASVAYGAPMVQALMAELPALQCVGLQGESGLQMSLQLFFDEAFASHQGRGSAVDRLGELVLIHLLRVVLRTGQLRSGVLAAMSDPRLSRALHAIHGDAAKPWTLEQLAIVAGMSRARFAAQFAQVVGMPPGEYLTRWRIGLAQGLLLQGRQVKQVADEVGYGSATALARAFSHQTGESPSEWLRQRQLAAATAHD